MTTASAAATSLQAAMIGLFESMHDGLRFHLDDRLQVVAAGGHGLAVFGCTPTQMIGKVILSFLPPALAEGMAPRLEAALAGQASSVKALRHMGARTPVILMSGHPMGEDPAELDELQIAAWVEKPPRSALLAQALAEALGGALEK